tara:strand:+ start:1659 stop:2642 length:984 start_codon:yes stop_codon:yes gene_type:complete
MENIKPLINSLQNFAQKRLGFKRPPKLFFKQDTENAAKALGQTAFYNPQEESITLFVSERHPKDILRSYAHELVHHTQNLRGDLSPEKCGEMSMGYAQNNDHLREMEREAYEKGNMCFRDWEDQYKTQVNVDNLTINLKENKKMVKISKKELKGLIEKILESRLEKNEIVEEVEELEEGGCGSHAAARDDDKKKKDPCENCKGKGCEQCKKSKEEVKEGKARCCNKDGCPGPGMKHPKEGKYAIKLEENEELEEGEVKNQGPYTTGMEAGYDDDGDGVPNGGDPNPKDGSVKESKIQTPEQEEVLYESRFGKRNEEIFNKLTKLWAK